MMTDVLLHSLSHSTRHIIAYFTYYFTLPHHLLWSLYWIGAQVPHLVKEVGKGSKSSNSRTMAMH